MNSKIKIGIIGCGWIVEKAYLPVLLSLKDVEVCAIFDNDPIKLDEIQKEYNIPNKTTNIYNFLSLSIDAVIIATPNNTHKYYTDMSLNLNKHVLCEKPVAFSKKDIESSINISLANRKIFMPAFVNRFRKDISDFGKMVSLVTEIIEVEVIWNRKSGIPRPGTWITNKAVAGGGVLIDIGTHVIDIGLSFILDKRIESAKMTYKTTDYAKQKGAEWNNNKRYPQLMMDVETYANGEVLFSNQTMLKFNVDWAADINEDITSIKVVGTNGIASINTLFGFSNNFVRSNIEILYNGKSGNKKIRYPLKNTFALDAFSDMIKYFVGTINEEKTVESLSISDGIHVVEVIGQLYETASVS